MLSVDEFVEKVKEKKINKKNRPVQEKNGTKTDGDLGLARSTTNQQGCFPFEFRRRFTVDVVCR